MQRKVPTNSNNFWHICIYIQRYKVNKYVKNEQEEASDGDFFHYVRPYIPFFSVQELTFSRINELSKVPPQTEPTCPRYVLNKLERTWIDEEDKNWFDREDVFNELKNDLVEKIQSKLVVDNESRSNSIF